LSCHDDQVLSTVQAIASQLKASGAAWLKTAQAAKLIGLSPSCLKNYRLNQKILIEGVHWVTQILVAARFSTTWSFSQTGWQLVLTHMSISERLMHTWLLGQTKEL
jgi:hypothetical protein